ncbi:amyloid beta A4 precursor protein-binding family B member 1-interacting protein-like [Polyodon spathula]|uniref:amyloid beta A4 precursor protein-binding family B member 1-interacting protein-like n=1 Tax=Polyodon spathula TaxID=7913 RepID=UPI001B7F7327|nr:amyloid beta A4 precursor protein-binding family B member 1-interacting protein-like [Polyodon spathula]
MDEIDAMFSDLLGEMDLLTQSLGDETVPSQPPPSTELNYSVDFKGLNESLNELEDNELDALMADLAAEVYQPEINLTSSTLPPPPEENSFSAHTSNFPAAPNSLHCSGSLPLPPRQAVPATVPAPPPEPSAPLSQEEKEAQAKADKIKLALEKLQEAKVKKLVIKVLMNDSSSKTLMVDERQTVRDILDHLFEKSHCDCSVEWCLYEINPDLQIERFFEDHENLVEVLSQWTRDSENKILFVEKPNKYAVFKNPQNFYIGKKEKKEAKDMKEKDKESLLKESFCGTSVIVPDLEGALYLKEDGKKSWKRRYFLLRASGIYYVPKGKTKTSQDLACFIQFDNVHVYYGTQYKNKYKAPTDYCFVLKHPQIQKESQYIKYLCCDDRWLMHLWVTGIRIAKYGKTMYDNYNIAVQKAGLASKWSNRSNVESKASSGTAAVRANGHQRQAPPSVSTAFSEAWQRAEMTKDNKTSGGGTPSFLPPPPLEEELPPPPPDPVLKMPQSSPKAPPRVAQQSPGIAHKPQIYFPPPPPIQDDEYLPPPPDDFPEPPPDFLPPPPPNPVASSGGSAAPTPPAPPLPPPVATAPPLKRIGPPPPMRTTPISPAASSSGQPDFMSELMNAMNKKGKK